MQYKVWLRSVFILSLMLSIPVISFNFFMDPLWTFSHSHKYNQAQSGFNERQLKMNKLYFTGLNGSDALLLGSSRSTYINQHDFKNMKVFNLACADMLPYEYQGWIDIAEKIKQNHFKYIIIGIDFWGANENLQQEKRARNKQPQEYFQQSGKLLYRYKSLISYDTFKKARENLRLSRDPSTTDYTRDNIKKTIAISDERKKIISQLQYKRYKEHVYGSSYLYQSDWKKTMADLKQNNPDSTFIVFTTPVSIELYDLLIAEGNFNDYSKWLCDAVDTFGEIYDFMGANSITSKPENYPDLHHFYPEVGAIIARKISPKNADMRPKDFGFAVNKENISHYLMQKQRNLQLK